MNFGSSSSSFNDTPQDDILWWSSQISREALLYFSLILGKAQRLFVFSLEGSIKQLPNSPLSISKRKIG
jgi:hypothetical protein